MSPDPALGATAEPVELDPVTSGYKFDGTVYTFGFGSDHDASLLEAISTQGGGVYYYIDSNDKIPESFADCLGGLLSVMGQNLTLKLETIGNNSFKTVHANRKIKWSAPNKSCEIQMGDLQSEEERDIVLELALPALPGPVEGDPVIRAQLSYFNVVTSQMDTVDCQLKVNRTDGEKGPGNMAVDTQRNRILTTAVLKQAESLADEDKLTEAQAELNKVIQTLQTSLSREQEFCKALVSDLQKCLESMTSRHAYRSHGKLMVANKMQSHAVQRSNFVDESSSYQSNSKKAYRAKARGIGKK